MFDLTADPSSQVTREYVAKEILGWKPFQYEGVEEGKAFSYLMYHPPNMDSIYADDLPDFLHDSAWTGPLWMKLMELNGNDKTLRICWCHECKMWEVTTGIDYFDKNQNAFKKNKEEIEIGSMDLNINIAIAQAIQQIREGHDARQKL